MVLRKCLERRELTIISLRQSMNLYATAVLLDGILYLIKAVGSFFTYLTRGISFN